MATSGEGQASVLAQFREVTGLDEQAATQFLEATNWRLEDAVDLHLASAGAENEAEAEPELRTPEDTAPVTPGTSDEDLHETMASLGDVNGRAADTETTTQAPAVPHVTAEELAATLARRRQRSVFESDTDEDSHHTPAPPEDDPPQGWLSTIYRSVGSIMQSVIGVASEDFDDWFKAKYGKPVPRFSTASYGEAVTQALRESSLLLLWFHQAENEATEHMVRNILQNRIVCRILRRRMLLWAGDVARFEPAQLAVLLNLQSFPVLVLCQPLGATSDAIFCLEWPLGIFAKPLLRLAPQTPEGYIAPDDAVVALTVAAEDYTAEVARQEEEANRRAIRIAQERMLREEQDREFEEALLADALTAISTMEEESTQSCNAAIDAARQLAENSASEVARMDAMAEEAKESARLEALAEEARQVELQRTARGAEILAQPEDSPTDGPTAKLCLKLPSGERLSRSFLVERTIDEVYEWAHCCRKEASPLRFELCTSFPTSVLAERGATIGAAGLAPSAALLMRALEN